MIKLELTRLSTLRTSDPFPGDECGRKKCKGRIGVYSTHNLDGWIVRYLHCKSCGHKPQKNKLSERIATT